MFGPSERVLNALRNKYTEGTRVELVYMDDPYNRKLVPGCRGTVRHVDDMGTIHVRWDCGSSLGLAYDVDLCKIVEE